MAEDTFGLPSVRWRGQSALTPKPPQLEARELGRHFKTTRPGLTAPDHLFGRPVNHAPHPGPLELDIAHAGKPGAEWGAISCAAQTCVDRRVVVEGVRAADAIIVASEQLPRPHGPHQGPKLALVAFVLECIRNLVAFPCGTQGLLRRRWAVAAGQRLAAAPAHMALSVVEQVPSVVTAQASSNALRTAPRIGRGASGNLSGSVPLSSPFALSSLCATLFFCPLSLGTSFRFKTLSLGTSFRLNTLSLGTSLCLKTSLCLLLLHEARFPLLGCSCSRLSTGCPRGGFLCLGMLVLRVPGSLAHDHLPLLHPLLVLRVPRLVHSACCALYAACLSAWTTGSRTLRGLRGFVGFAGLSQTVGKSSSASANSMANGAHRTVNALD